MCVSTGQYDHAKRFRRVERKRSRMRYAGAAILLVLLAGIERWVATRPFVEEQVTDLNSLQQTKVDTFLEMNRFLATLSTATIGAIGAMIAQRYKSRAVPRAQIVRAVGGTVLAGMSLYLGYASYGRVVWMLDKGFMGVSTPALAWTSAAQFWTFLAAVLLFADFCYRDLRGGS